MAVSMPKVNPIKIGVVMLALVDLALLYPLYAKYSEDPLASLPIVAPVTSGGVQLQGGDDDDSGAIKTGRPPMRLYSWDPFKAPKIAGLGRSDEGSGEETETRPIEPQNMPISTDEFKLYGIISLNGQYRALMSQVGTPSEEVRRGMLVPGTPDVRVVEIHRDRVILSRPGAVNTPLLLNQPGLIGQPWFQGTDSFALRGRIRMER